MFLAGGRIPCFASLKRSLSPGREKFNKSVAGRQQDARRDCSIPHIRGATTPAGVPQSGPLNGTLKEQLGCFVAGLPSYLDIYMKSVLADNFQCSWRSNILCPLVCPSIQYCQVGLYNRRGS